MGYETAKFGDGVSTTRVTDVKQHFGAKETGDAVGVVKTEGAMNELSMTIDGTAASNGDFNVGPVFKLPAGAVVEDVYVKVTEAFVLGGTTPTILFGTDTSEVTNGFVISEAQAEAVASYDVTSTLTGTWAAPLAAETSVGLAMGGTTPTSTAAGKLKVIVRYALVGAA